MSELEYTEQGWRLTADTSRHHRERSWDYRGRGIYHLTLVVAERYPLFGKLKGDSAEQATVELSDFGREVWRLIRTTPQYYAHKEGYNLKILAGQIMPDHAHVVLQVVEPISQPIGQVIRGIKSACSAAYKRIYSTTTTALKDEREVNEISKDYTDTNDSIVHFARIFASRGSIWQSEVAHYHERILHKEGQLRSMIDYVKDNPRRLWLKRANPDLFRIRRQTKVAGIECTTLGNIFLAERPVRAVLQCSRTLTQAEIDAKREQCLAQADNGTVFISAAISEGEKQISRALRRNGYPMIILLQNGFPKPGDPHERYYKPGGEYFNACANEQLLLIEPSEALFDASEIEASVYSKAHDIPHSSQRYRFLALNAIAWMIEK